MFLGASEEMFPVLFSFQSIAPALHISSVLFLLSCLLPAQSDPPASHSQGLFGHTPHACTLRPSVVAESLRSMQPTRLLCPWDYPSEHGVGCQALLQGIFLTQGSSPQLPHLQVDSLPRRHLETPITLCLIG